MIAIALVALAAVGAAVAATRVRWGGGLGRDYGNYVGVPVRVDAPFSIGMAELAPEHRVRIESVRLHRPTRNIVLVGAVVYPPDRGWIGSAMEFPPNVAHMRLRPAVGTVVPAGTKLLLAVGLRTTSVGSSRVEGVDLLYRERWHGIDIRHKAHIGIEVGACAVKASARTVRCTVPRPSD